MRREIFDLLMEWKEIRSNLEPITIRAPLAKEALPYARDIESLCTIGLQAISSNILHSERWKNEANMLLDAINKERRECEIMILEPIKTLVESAR